MPYDNPSNRRYYALVASLPDLVFPLSAYKSVPLNDEELQSRLSMLDEKDYEDVVCVAELLCYQALEKDDSAVRQRFDAVIETVSHEGLKELARQNMRWRTVQAAVLLSCAGSTLPPLKEDETDNWGYDADLMEHIRANWSHPNFSLALSYPTIVPMRRMITDGRFASVSEWNEHTLWSHYVAMDEHYEFTVENVVLFVVRRKMVQNRLERDTQKAVSMIEQAVTTMIDKTELAL